MPRSDWFSDYKVGVLLDANENTHGPSLTEISSIEEKQELNRYPDPHQIEVKQLVCDFRKSEATSSQLKPENLFVGVGSDEAIDLLIRAVCRPGVDKLLICPPTYGMYSVSAQINDVEVVKVNLEFKKGHFTIKPTKVNEALAADSNIKLTYICSPGNPTGSLISREDIIKILENPDWNGLVVVDEAYIDFSAPGASMAPLVTKYPNLVVMQTLSKSFGLAGIRVGLAFASKEVATLLNSMKGPYNVSTLSSDVAKRALSAEGIKKMREYTAEIIKQRDFLVEELPKIKGIGEFVGGQDANFLLVELLDKDGKPSNDIAKRAYKELAENKNIVVRYRGSEPGCEGCLRISIGTADENKILLQELETVIKELYS